MPLFFHKFIVGTALPCAVGLLLTSLTASAQTKTYVANSPLSSSGQSTLFSLPVFDTNLGTLESVTISLQFDLSSEITVYNSSSGNIPFTNASLTVPVTADLPGGLDLVTQLTSVLSQGTAAPGENAYSMNDVITNVNETVPTAQFANWEGLPNQTLTLNLTPGDLTSQGTSSVQGAAFGGLTQQSGQISLTYTYTPALAAPEPSDEILSILVGAVMLLGIGNRLRRRVQAA